MRIQINIIGLFGGDGEPEEETPIQDMAGALGQLDRDATEEEYKRAVFGAMWGENE